MDKQNQHLYIKNREVYPRNYFLRKYHKELVHEINMIGGNIWAEFIIELFPTADKQISIELVDIATTHNYLRNTITTGIKQGIKQLKLNLNNNNIEIWGIHIKVTNLSYHPVDSKPRGYSYPLLALFNRLIHTDFFGMQINSNSLKIKIPTSDITDFDINKNRLIAKEMQLRIASPKHSLNTLVLSKQVETIIRNVGKGVDLLKITLSPKKKYVKSLYQIEFGYRNTYADVQFCKMGAYIEIYKQVEHILKEFKLRKINIAGFYILVESINNKEQLSFTNNEIKWIIFSALLDKNITQIKKENLPVNNE